MTSVYKQTLQTPRVGGRVQPYQGSGSGRAHQVCQSAPAVQYVVSKVTVYHSTHINLKWTRAIHHCDECDLGPGGTPGFRGRGHPCGAVHYGRCTPVSYPFPQNFRKKSPISILPPSVSGSIPVAKVNPTRPVKVAPEVITEQIKPSEDEVDSGKRFNKVT